MSFYGCEALTKAVFANGVVSIGDNAFSGCTLLTMYGYNNTVPEKYSDKNSIKFVILDNEPAITTSTVTTTPTVTTTSTVTTTPIVTTTPTVTTTASVTTTSTTTTASETTPTVTTSQTTAPSEKIGDINGDGKLTTSDARKVLQYAVGMVELDAQQIKLADINKDGKITTSDAVKLLRYIVGAVDELK